MQINNIDVALMIGGVLVVVGIILLIFLLWPKRPQKVVVPPVAPPVEEHSAPEDQAEEEADYDFLADEDSVPIKLDLARSYLEMGNYTAVEETLRGVLEIGTPEQQEQAQLLLEQAKLAQSDS